MNTKASSTGKTYEAEWKVRPGQSSAAVYVCSKCGKQSAYSSLICPNCKSIMKRIIW